MNTRVDDGQWSGIWSVERYQTLLEFSHAPFLISMILNEEFFVKTIFQYTVQFALHVPSWGVRSTDNFHAS